MELPKLGTDEARRVAHREAMKASVDRDVNTNIAARAEHATREESSAMDKVAGEFRHQAISDVVGTDREVRRARTVARISQVIDYLFFLIYGLLAIRLVLALIGARSANGFVRIIRAVTDPFYAPFNGIVSSPSVEGYTLAVPIIIAMVVYALLHLGLTRLMRLVAHRKTEI